jgi:hypothetical protein
VNEPVGIPTVILQALLHVFLLLRLGTATVRPSCILNNGNTLRGPVEDAYLLVEQEDEMLEHRLAVALTKHLVGNSDWSDWTCSQELLKSHVSTYRADET